MLGAFCGLILLLLSVQLYTDFTTVFTDKEEQLLSDDYLVVNKQVSVATTSNLFKPGFTPTEIEQLSDLPPVVDLGLFSSNNFEVRAMLPKGRKDVPHLYMELFFEAVPDRLLDVPAENFTWKEGDSIIPIVISSDYLALYNFGFAPSQGLPKFSRKTIQLITLDIRINGNDQVVTMKGKIAGFTDRINSVLVPENFLEWANSKYGHDKPERPSRVIVQTKDASDPQLFQYLNEKGYVTNAEQLKNSKVSSVLEVVLSVAVSVGGLIIILSVLGFLQYAQILIGRTRYEIEVLIKIGYNYLSLCKTYLLFFSLLFLVIATLTLVTLLATRSYFVAWISESGFEVPASISGYTILAGLALLTVYAAISALNIVRMIKGIATPQK